MSRKLFFVAITLALPVVFVVTIGSGVASAKPKSGGTPVTFVGAVSCNLTGTVSIIPAAFNNLPQPSYTITFTGKNSHCVGLPYVNSAGGTTTTSLTQGGEKLKASTETFKFTVGTPGALTYLCKDLEYGGSLPFSGGGAITWIGTSPITPTTVSFPVGSTIFVNPPIIALPNGATSGSFAGTTDISLGYNVANVFTACASTTGFSGGPVNDVGGDNLLVGPGF